MSLIQIESIMTVKIPCEIPATDLYANNITEMFSHYDGNTYIKFYNADLKECHLRTIELLIRNLCDKYPDNKMYKRLRSDVCQLVHSIS